MYVVWDSTYQELTEYDSFGELEDNLINELRHRNPAAADSYTIYRVERKMKPEVVDIKLGLKKA